MKEGHKALPSTWTLCEPYLCLILKHKAVADAAQEILPFVLLYLLVSLSLEPGRDLIRLLTFMTTQNSIYVFMGDEGSYCFLKQVWLYKNMSTIRNKLQGNYCLHYVNGVWDLLSSPLRKSLTAMAMTVPPHVYTTICHGWSPLHKSFSQPLAPSSRGCTGPWKNKHSILITLFTVIHGWAVFHNLVYGSTNSKIHKCSIKW